QQPGEGQAAEAAPDAALGEAGAPQAETGAEGEAQRHTLRLRNWRRRHRTVRPAPRLGEAEGSAPNAEPGTAEPIANTAEGAPGNRNPLRARRRRRRPPISGPGDRPETAAGEAAPGQEPGEIPTRPLGTRPPRSRNRRRRRPAVASAATPTAGDGANGAAAPSERPAGRRDRDQRGRARQADTPRGPDQHSRGPRDRDRRDGGARGDQRGRGRGGPPGGTVTRRAEKTGARSNRTTPVVRDV